MEGIVFGSGMVVEQNFQLVVADMAATADREKVLRRCGIKI